MIAFGIVKNLEVTPKKLKDIDTQSLEFCGLIAFADELRPEAKSAVAIAKEAGINVRLITGDHIETAYTIGNKVGIASARDQAVQGSELPNDQKALAALVSTKSVYARNSTKR